MALEKPRTVFISITSDAGGFALADGDNQQYLNRLRFIYVVPGENAKISIVYSDGDTQVKTGFMDVAAGVPFKFSIDDWRAGGFCLSAGRGKPLILLCDSSLNGWAIVTDEQ